MSAFIIARNLYLLLLVLLGVTDYFIFDIHIGIYIGLTITFLVLVAVGSAKIQLNFFTSSLTHFSLPEKAIALTFDDGPSPEYTPGILKILEKYQAQGTFFCIGEKIIDSPKIVKKINKKGHALGNHSYSHSNFFSFYRKKKIIKEINKTNQLLFEATGKECTIFRPPFGVTNPSIARAVKKTAMRTIGWNIRSFDTAHKDPNIVIERVISKIKPGAIILLHDDRANTAKILEAILLYATANDYKCIAIHQIEK